MVLLWSAIAIVRTFPGPIWVALLGLTVLTAYAAVRTIGFPMTLSLSDAFIVAATLLFGPGVGAVTVACDAAMMSTRLNRARLTAGRIGFNIAAPALALWLSAHLFFWLLGSAPFRDDGVPPLERVVMPLLVFAAVYFLINTWFVAAAIATGRAVSIAIVWRQHLVPLWPTHAAGTALGGFLTLLIGANPDQVPTFAWAVGTALLVGIGIEIARHRRFSVTMADLRSCAAALRSTKDAVILADAEGRITFINAAAERLTGWTIVEARGRSVTEVFCVTTGMEPRAPGEYSLLRRDGTSCPIEESHAEILDEDESLNGSIRTFRDIRHRKQLEAERHTLFVREQEAHAAAAAASRTKDEFLATLSHELRTPATAILGWTRLLKGGVLDEAGARRALDALDRSARAQAAVLNDIIDESRIVRGTLRLDIRRVQVGDIIRDALETVEPAAAAKRIRLVVDLGQGLPVIDADPDRLRQVLWNLLANAVKFTPEGGHIDITGRHLSDTIQVSVTDTGCGITPEFLPYVFDRFRQEDASPTRPHAGLGLGLAIVKHLVEAHGGTVSAESAGAGQGARFTVTLPAVIRHRTTDGAERPPLAVDGSRRATDARA
jgi:PAS domain S-box-containing protein